MVRAAIYARTAAADPAGLAAQERRCRGRAAARGWAVAGVWRDTGSGRDPARPGLRALRAALAAGAAGTLVATDAARLGRDPAGTGRLLAELASSGVEVDLLDGGPAAAVARACAALVAERERRG